MNYPRLDWFLCVAETGNISKAADLLYTSQQSLSAHIKRLEAFYGAPLFHRGHGVTLTAQGEIIYRNGKKILQRDQQLRTLYEKIRQNEHGRIRFGLSIARSQIFLPKIIPEYQSLYPGVDIQIYEGSTADLGKRLNRRELDLYLGKDLQAGPSIEKEVLSNDRLYAIVPNQLAEKQFGPDAKSVMARFRSGVYLRELEDFPFITIDPASKNFKHIDNYCQTHQIHFQNAIQVTHTPLLIELCHTGYGAGLCLETFLPKVLQHAGNSNYGSLNIFPVLDQISDWDVIMANHIDSSIPDYFSDFKSIVRRTVTAIY